MSITSEINRISGNISDSLSAVATKGITVPSGSNSDDLAGLISQIPSTYTVTLNLTGASSSASGTKVASGGSYFTTITPTTSGHKISSITVTMGGVDITSQVFKSGVGAKVVNANGTYQASSDNLDGYSTVYVDVPSSETDEVTVTTGGTVSYTLQPNIAYHFTSNSLTSLSLAFGGNATDQYHFDFVSPATAVTLTLPSSVVMESSFHIESNTKYEIDVLNNAGVYAEWAVSNV